MIADQEIAELIDKEIDKISYVLADKLKEKYSAEILADTKARIIDTQVLNNDNTRHLESEIRELREQVNHSSMLNADLRLQVRNLTDYLEIRGLKDDFEHSARYHLR